MLRTVQLLPLLQGVVTGLRYRAFPPGTASQLPGSLAITRTGLAPAGNDELAMSGFLSGVTSILLGIRVVRRHPHPVSWIPEPPPQKPVGLLPHLTRKRPLPILGEGWGEGL